MYVSMLVKNVYVSMYVCIKYNVGVFGENVYMKIYVFVYVGVCKHVCGYVSVWMNVFM